MQNLSCCLGVVIIACHNAGTLYAKLTDIALLNFVAVFINNLALPAIAGDSDCADFVNIADSEMNTAWAC